MTCILWQLAVLGLTFVSSAVALPPVALTTPAPRWDYDEVARNYGRAGTSTQVVIQLGSTDENGSTHIIQVTSALTSSISSTRASSSSSTSSTSQSSSASQSSTASSGPASTSSPAATPVPAPADNSGGGGLSGGAIAGIVIGVVAAVIIAAAVGYLLARRNKKKKIQAGTNPHPTENHYTAGPPPKSEGPYVGPSNMGTTTTAAANPNAYNSYTEGYHPNPLNVHNPQTMSELPADSAAARPTQQQFAPPQPRYAADTGPQTPDGRQELS